MLELQDTCEGNAPESKKGMHNKVGTCVEILPFCVCVFLKSWFGPIIYTRKAD